MDRDAVKDLIVSKLNAETISFTEGAVERLLDPRYLRDEALAAFSAAENRAGVEKVVAQAIKRYRKRAARSKAEAVTFREIDSRTIARDAFGTVPPYQLPKPVAPAEAEKPADAESDAEIADAQEATA